MTVLTVLARGEIGWNAVRVSESAAAVTMLGLFFGVLVLSGPLMLLAINRRLPWGISRRLRAGTPSISRRTSYTAGAWNPAKPLGRGNATPNEPGWATYTLTDDGMVRLELVLADGRREQQVGPPVEPPTGQRRVTLAGLIPTAGYLVGTGGGLAIGLLIGGAIGALVGAVIGFAVAWFALILASGAWQAGHAQEPPSASGPPSTIST